MHTLFPHFQARSLRALLIAALLLTLLPLTGGSAAAQDSGSGSEERATAANPESEETTTERNDPMSRPRVHLQTSKGDLTIELYQEEAPKSAANFLAYVESGFYDGTIFHRVIPGFMVQGGGFSADMSQKETRDPIENEADNGMKNKRGTLAMARTMDPNSATAQFFVNTVDNTFLNHTAKNAQGWGYTVFAEVVEGMDVIDAIVKVPTGSKGGHQNVPNEPVVIEKVTVVDAE